jgi:hypothetical protein
MTPADLDTLSLEHHQMWSELGPSDTPGSCCDRKSSMRRLPSEHSMQLSPCCVNAACGAFFTRSSFVTSPGFFRYRSARSYCIRTFNLHIYWPNPNSPESNLS